MVPVVGKPPKLQLIPDTSLPKSRNSWILEWPPQIKHLLIYLFFENLCPPIQVNIGLW